MSKRVSTTLLLIVVIAIVSLYARTESNAICIIRILGTCILEVGNSVKAVLTAEELGDYIKNPKSLGFEILPMDPKTNKIHGHLYCKDPNSLQSKIIPSAEFSGKLGFSVIIKEKDIYQCQTMTAIVPAIARLSDTELRDLDQKYCPEPNLHAISFVPYEFNTIIALKDAESKKVLDDVNYKCVLPAYETLGWNKEGSRPESRQYDCK